MDKMILCSITHYLLPSKISAIAAPSTANTQGNKLRPYGTFTMYIRSGTTYEGSFQRKGKAKNKARTGLNVTLTKQPHLSNF